MRTESGRDRRALVADAGYGQLSLFSILAGVLSAFGTLAVMAGAAAALARADGREVELAVGWQLIDRNEGLAGAAALFVAFLVGGYVAGRMARRAGVLHGLAVSVVGLGVATAGYFVADLSAPASAVAVAAAAIVLGALAGGVLGERWHAKLVARALDPDVGAEAKARRDAERRAADAERARTGAYERARLATPTRTRRVDGEAVEARRDQDRDFEEIDPPDLAPTPAPTAPLSARSGGRTG
jgi:hypothetical protein